MAKHFIDINNAKINVRNATAEVLKIKTPGDKGKDGKDAEIGKLEALLTAITGGLYGVNNFNPAQLANSAKSTKLENTIFAGLANVLGTPKSNENILSLVYNINKELRQVEKIKQMGENISKSSTETPEEILKLLDVFTKNPLKIQDSNITNSLANQYDLINDSSRVLQETIKQSVNGISSNNVTNNINNVAPNNIDLSTLEGIVFDGFVDTYNKIDKSVDVLNTIAKLLNTTDGNKHTSVKGTAVTINGLDPDNITKFINLLKVKFDKKDFNIDSIREILTGIFEITNDTKFNDKQAKNNINSIIATVSSFSELLKVTEDLNADHIKNIKKNLKNLNSLLGSDIIKNIFKTIDDLNKDIDDKKNTKFIGSISNFISTVATFGDKTLDLYKTEIALSILQGNVTSLGGVMKNISDVYQTYADILFSGKETALDKIIKFNTDLRKLFNAQPSIKEITKFIIATNLNEEAIVEYVRYIESFEKFNKNKFDNIYSLLDILIDHSELVSLYKKEIVGGLNDLNEIISLLDKTLFLSKVASVLYKDKTLDKVIKSVDKLSELVEHFNDSEIVKSNIDFNKLRHAAAFVTEFSKMMVMSSMVSVTAVLGIPGLFVINKSIQILSKIISNIDKLEISKESIKNLTEVSKLIAFCGGILIAATVVGAYVTSNFGYLLEFGVTLTLFTTSLLFVLSKVGKNLKEGIVNAKELGTLVAYLGGILIAGALFMMIPNIAQGVIAFGLTLTLFITGVTFGISLLNKLDSMNSDMLDTFARTVTVLGGIMVSGALLMMIPGLIGSTIVFGGLLTAFITVMGGALVLISKFVNKDTIESIERFAKIVALAGGLLLLGGAIMLIPGMVESTITFTIALGTFVLGMGGVFVLINKLASKDVSDNVKNFANLVALCGLVMIAGAMVATSAGILVSAFLFLGAMTLFVVGASLVFKLVSAIVDSDVEIQLSDFGKLIALCTITMAMGAFFMMVPGLWLNSLMFVGALSLFMLGMSVSFLILSKANSGKTLKEVVAFGTLVGMMTLVMMVGAAFMFIPNMWQKSLEFVGICSLFMAGMALAFWGMSQAVTQDIVKKTVAFGALTLLFASIMTIGALFMFIPGMWKNALLFAGTLVVFTGVMALVFYGVTKAVEKVNFLGLVAFGLMTAFMGFVMVVGAKYMEKEGMFINALLFTVATAAFVIGMGGVIKLISILLPYSTVIKSLLPLAAILGLGYLTGKILDQWITIAEHGSGKWDDVLSALKYAGLIIGGFAVVIGLLGAICYTGVGAAIIAMGTVALAGIVGVAMMTANLLDTLINVATKAKGLNDVEKSFDNIKLVLTSFTGIAEYLGPFVNPLFALRVKLASGSIGSMGRMISDISQAVKDYAELSVPIYEGTKKTGYQKLTVADFASAGTNVGLIITTLSSAVMSVYESNPEMFEDPFIGDNPFSITVKSVTKLGNAISKIASSVKDYATLKVPVYKGTKIVGYDTLDKSHFENASSNVRHIITTLSETVLNLYNNNPEMFEDPFIGDNPFSVTVKSVTKLGNAISKIAGSVKDYANMTIPVYDAQGKEVGKRLFKSDDFTEASTNIGKIITTLGSTVISVYENNPELFEDGWFSDGAFVTVTNCMDKLGNMISKIAKGVQDYADLKIPIYSATSDKIQGYRTFGDNDFIAANKNINKVITVIGQSLITTYNENKDTIFKDGASSPVFVVLEAAGKIGNVISKISSGVQDYANLKIPIYEENSTKIHHYQKMDDSMFSAAGKTIGKVIVCVGTALQQVYKDHTELFEKDSDSVIFTVINAASKMGKAISDISKGIQAFADLKIPIYTGDKITSYEKMDKTAFETAQENITSMVVCCVKSILNAYNDPDLKPVFDGIAKDSKDNPLAIVQDAMKGTDEFISSMAKSISDIANLTITNYVNGKESGKIRLLDADFTNTTATISSIIKTIAQAVSDTYKDNTKLFDDGTIKKVAESLIPVTKLISDMSRSIVEYSSGMVPDGKGGQIKMDSKMYQDAAENIKTILPIIGQAIIEVYNKDNTVFGDPQDPSSIFAKVVLSFNGVGTLLKEIAVGIKSVMDLKIPEESKITEQVVSIVTSLGGAFIEAYNKGNSDKYGNLFDSSFLGLVDSPFNKVKKTFNGLGKLLTEICGGYKSVLNLNINPEDLKEDGKISNTIYGLVETMPISFHKVYNVLDEADALDLSDYRKLQKIFDEVSKSMQDITKFYNSLQLIADSGKRSVFMVRTIRNFGLIGKNLYELISSNIIRSNSTDNFIILGEYISILKKISNIFHTLPESNEKSDLFRIAIIGINDVIKTTPDLKSFKEEVELIERYTKTLNNLDVNKVNSFNTLVNSINNLAHNLGNIDSLTEALAVRLAGVLKVLSEEIKKSAITIDKADQIQQRRYNQMKQAAKTIESLMKNPLDVNVTHYKTDQDPNVKDQGVGGDRAVSNSSNTSSGGTSVTPSGNTVPSSVNNDKGVIGGGTSDAPTNTGKYVSWNDVQIQNNGVITTKKRKH